MNTRNLCLGALFLRDASGYEIKKMFESTFRHFQKTSFGSIYPALNQLTDAGLVTYREETQEKRPNKKVFSITDKGRKRFLNNLQRLEPTEQFRSDFLILMLFSNLLSEERRVEILAQQHARLQEELDTLQTILDQEQNLPAGVRFTLEYGITANRALCELMERRSAPLLQEIARELKEFP